MTYNDIFTQERDSALKARQIDALIQHQRATEAYNEQMAIRQAYQDTMREQQGMRADQSANLLMNTYNPPSAMAVPRDPNNPDDVAWARNANGQRTRYLQSNRLQPGPAQPYTGGAKEMPQARALMPKVDAVGARQEDRQAFQEATQLEKSLAASRMNLSQYLPNVDTITGLDTVDPTTGAHDPSAKALAVASGDSRSVVNFGPKASSWWSKSSDEKSPFDSAPKTNPIHNVDQLLQAYRDYSSQRNRLNTLKGSSPTAPAGAPPAQIPAGPAPSAQGLQPGAKVRQGGKVYLIQPDGTPAEIQ